MSSTSPSRSTATSAAEPRSPEASSGPVAAAIPDRTLSGTDWFAARTRHLEKLRPVLDPYLDRRSRGRDDPIMDFLFEYYSFRPSALRTWSPGLGTAVTVPGETAVRSVLAPGEGLADVPDPDLFRTDDRERLFLDPNRFPAHRLDAARWILRLLRRTRDREPFFGCHGLHEWAMVYRSDRVRHADVPLRLSESERERVVEEQIVDCAHFDAFRFFTDAARPLNRRQPTHERMPDLEQPGCLHTNMDCYRWAFKFHPWIGGDLVADAFLTACRIRVADMRASPYDLREYGLEPIRVETAAGRRTYRELQRKMHRETAPLRNRLIRAYERILNTVDRVE